MAAPPSSLTPANLTILIDLGIDPIFQFFFAPTFVHPALRLADPYTYVPYNHVPLALTFGIVSFVLLTITCFTRIAGRSYVLRVFGYEDAAILAAWAMNAGTLVVYIWGIKHAGLGYHLYDINFEQLKNNFIVQYAVIWPSTIASTLTRLSILAWIQSILPVTERRIRYGIYGLHIFNVFLCFFAICPVIFQCLPYTWVAWELPIVNECVQKGVDAGRVLSKLSVSAVSLATALDFAILAVPIRLVWSLRVPRTKRLAVSAIFAVGGGTCIASLVRAYFIAWSFGRRDNMDLSWGLTITVGIVQVENCLGMITACSPHIKAAIARIRHGAPNSPQRGTLRSLTDPEGGSGSGGARRVSRMAGVRSGKNSFELEVSGGESRLNLTASRTDEEMGDMRRESGETEQSRVKTAEGVGAVSVMESR